MTNHIKVSLYRNFYSDDFEDKNLRHLFSLLTREEMLKHLPQNAIVVKMSVNEGEFSDKILKYMKGSAAFGDHNFDSVYADTYH